MSLWDEYEGAGNYVSFADVGDTFSGTLLAVNAKTWPAENNKPARTTPQLLMRRDGDGEEVTLTAGWALLIAALKREAPNVGDHLKITLTGIGPKPKETKEWDLVVTRGNGAPAPTPTASTPAPPAPPAPAAPAPDGLVAAPGVDLAAYRAAGWTDEQLIAAGHASRPAPAAPPAPPAPPSPPAPPAPPAASWDTDPRVAPLRSAGWTDEQIRSQIGV